MCTVGYKTNKKTNKRESKVLADDPEVFLNDLPSSGLLSTCFHSTHLPDVVARLDVHPPGMPTVAGSILTSGNKHCFVEIGHEIIIPPQNVVLLYPPQNVVLGGYTVFSMSVIL